MRQAQAGPIVPACRSVSDANECPVATLQQLSDQIPPDLGIDAALAAFVAPQALSEHPGKAQSQGGHHDEQGGRQTAVEVAHEVR